MAVGLVARKFNQVSPDNNYKGKYEDLSSLKVNIPSANKDDFAFLGENNSLALWDNVSSNWVRNLNTHRGLREVANVTTTLLHSVFSSSETQAQPGGTNTSLHINIAGITTPKALPAGFTERIYIKQRGSGVTKITSLIFSNSSSNVTLTQLGTISIPQEDDAWFGLEYVLKGISDSNYIVIFRQIDASSLSGATIRDRLKSLSNGNKLSTGDLDVTADKLLMSQAQSDKLANLTDNFKGHHATSTSLTTAHPTGQAGWWAIVNFTDTVWLWDTDTNQWVNSGNSAPTVAIVDALTDQSTNKALSANQGYVLKGLIDALDATVQAIDTSIVSEPHQMQVVLDGTTNIVTLDHKADFVLMVSLDGSVQKSSYYTIDNTGANTKITLGDTAPYLDGVQVYVVSYENMALSSYLPLSGGVITGSLTVQGGLSLPNLSLNSNQTHTLIYNPSDGSISYVQMNLQRVCEIGSHYAGHVSLGRLSLAEMHGDGDHLLWSDNGDVKQVSLGANLSLDQYGTLSASSGNIKPDWNADPAASNGISNRPMLAAVATSGQYSDLAGRPTLHVVASTGSYNDLQDKPTIPAAQVNSDWNATTGIAKINNKPVYLVSSWTPAAILGVTLTGASGQYARFGELVIVNFQYTVPTNSDTNGAEISLPLASKSGSYFGACEVIKASNEATYEYAVRAIIQRAVIVKNASHYNDRFLSWAELSGAVVTGTISYVVNY